MPERGYKTGYFIRAKTNDGRWISADIATLTDPELDQLEKDYPERGWMWAKALAAWIRDKVDIDEGE